MSSGLNVIEIRAGAHRMFWGDTQGTETELGFTTEGSVLRVETGAFEIQTEEDADSPEDAVYLGERVTVLAALRQFDNSQLLVAIPGSTESAGPTIKQLNFGSQAGKNARTAATAKRLRLHPITVSDITDEDDDFILHKAIVIAGPIEVPLRNRAVREIAIQFLALVDRTQPDGSRLGRWKKDKV